MFVCLIVATRILSLLVMLKLIAFNFSSLPLVGSLFFELFNADLNFLSYVFKFFEDLSAFLCLTTYLKEFTSKLKQYVLRNPFNLFVLSLGVVSFLYQFYIFSVFSIVTLIYYKFVVSYLPSWDDEKLLLEHKAINELNFDKIEFSLTQVLVIFVILAFSFYFNVVFAKFYLAFVVFVVIIRFSGFKITTASPKLISTYKRYRKDSLTLKYHWYIDFQWARDIVYISFGSLFICCNLALIATTFLEFSPPVVEWNTKLWWSILTTTILFSILIDIYISLLK